MRDYLIILNEDWVLAHRGDDVLPCDFVVNCLQEHWTDCIIQDRTANYLQATVDCCKNDVAEFLAQRLACYDDFCADMLQIVDLDGESERANRVATQNTQPPSDVPNGAYAANLMNAASPCGCFAYDEGLSKMTFRYSLPVTGCLISQKTCAVVLDAVCLTMFDFYGYLAKNF